MADIAPSVHPTKDISELQGLIKLVTEVAFKAFEGLPQSPVEGTRMLTAKASDPKVDLHFWDHSDAFFLNESIV